VAATQVGPCSDNPAIGGTPAGTCPTHFGQDGSGGGGGLASG